MRLLPAVPGLICGIFSIVTLHAADFTNLSFDEAPLVESVVGGDISTFLPGWTLR
jgi:hypothetical protein